jgi:short subunit dehydrogenase-like uncharacterized protein
MGFDEVPADVALARACAGFERPEAVVTYAVPTTGSAGTIRSALGILSSTGLRVKDGLWTDVRTGDERRWAPMPPPLGVRQSVSAPFAIARLAPLHVSFESLEVFMTIRKAQLAAMTLGLPLLRRLMKFDPGRFVADMVIDRLPEGPSATKRSAKWTILAEAKGGDGRWCNVAVVGRDVYGLTAELLAAGAGVMATQDYDRAGVLSPVQAMGLDFLQQELTGNGVTIEVFGESG